MTSVTSTRADARRNRSALLRAGQDAFRARGLEASMDDVAKLAGVGKGTVYRHFPTKEHLIAAIFQDHFDQLAKDASALLSADDPGQAVITWLRAFDRGPAHLPGLHEGLVTMIAGDTEVVSAACRPTKDNFRQLLARAQNAGAIRDDIDSSDLLHLVAALPHTRRRANDTSPLLDVILRGMRPDHPRTSTDVSDSRLPR